MRKPTQLFKAFAAVILVLLTVSPAAAVWEQNGFLAEGDVEILHSPQSIQDGEGGMIVTWADGRMDDNNHIFAQRFNAQGEALWQDGGVPVCTYPGGTQITPALSPDNEGGVYFIWQDVTNGGTAHVYAQHVNSTGGISWATNGILLDDASPVSVTSTMMTTADDGTAYAAWVETASSGYRRLKLMRLNTSGKMWATASNTATLSSGYFDFPVMDCTTLGATVVFGRYNSTYGRTEVFSSTMGPDGNNAVSPSAVYNDGNDQYSHQISTDPLGGYFIAWQLYGPNGTNQDITLAHVDASGYSTPATMTVCNHYGIQKTPFLTGVEDGVIVTWEDHRYLEDNIFAQKVTLGMTAQWSTNGREICSTSASKELQSIFPDDVGGALINWYDQTTSAGTRYSQRVNADGGIDWHSDGIAYTAAGYNQGNGSEVSDGHGGLLGVWSDTVHSNHGLKIQRIEENGYWGYPSPEITFVEDIPGDQGGKLLLSYTSSRLDSGPENGVAYYTFWRALPADKTNVIADDNWLELITAEKTADPVIRMETNGNKILYWELIHSRNPYNLPGYSITLNTLSDHTETNEGLHHFQVMAHAVVTGRRWTSEPGQGWSVDNLGPSLVMGLLGNVVAEPAGYDISWQPNAESDIHHYVVHRGLSADFNPTSGNLLGLVTETSFLDLNWDGNTEWKYKVAGVDIHANLGEFGLLESGMTSGVNPIALPTMTALQGNHPNPFNPSTTISYELATSTHVRLEIFDASGRLVRTLVDETQDVGRREIVWNGRASGNRNLPSGVYLYRLQAGEMIQTKRMTLLK